MMKKILFSSIFLLFVLLVACDDDDDATAIRDVIARGYIDNPQVTAWNYGTHVLVSDDDSIMFALRSSVINLDYFVDHEVELYGRLQEGYPVDTGPHYMQVLALTPLDSVRSD